MSLKQPGIYLVLMCASMLFGFLLSGDSVSASPDAAAADRRVNATYWAADDPDSAPAIFWFGEIDLTANYIDGRIGRQILSILYLTPKAVTSPVNAGWFQEVGTKDWAARL